MIFYQTFLSPQVKPCTIITYKHGISELPCELLNDLSNIKRVGNIRRMPKPHRMIGQHTATPPNWKSRQILRDRPQGRRNTQVGLLCDNGQQLLATITTTTKRPTLDAAAGPLRPRYCIANSKTHVVLNTVWFVSIFFLIF